MINGKEEKIAADENGYLNLKRPWKKDDHIEIIFPMGIYAVSMPDNKTREAFFYGPVLLAGVLGNTEPDPVKGIPVVVAATNSPSEWIQKSKEHDFTFTSLKVGQPADIVFHPFNTVKNEYYSVYFDVFSNDDWKNEQAKYEAEKMRIQQVEAHTIDALRMGEMQPERDHTFTGNAITGEGHGRKWRGTRDGGSLSFVLKVDGISNHELLMSYWGMDNRGRIFDILVDGEFIATEDINKYKSSRFYDIVYPVPVTLTKGKEKVTITLRAKSGNNVGPVYGTVRMMKK
jgi:hypothetical protein